MDENEGKAYSYLKTCYINGCAGKESGFIPEKFRKDYGATGIKQYFLFGVELIGDDPDVNLIKWYTSWFDLLHSFGPDQDLIKGMMDSFSSRKPDMALFIENMGWGSSISLASVFMRVGDLNNPEVLKTTLWIASIEKYVRNPKLLENEINLISSSLINNDDSVRITAFDCAMSLSHPALIPAIVKFIREKINSRCSGESELGNLFKVLLHTMWWPGPEWEQNVFTLKKSVKLVLEELSKFPVTMYTAKKLDQAIKELKNDAALTTDWASERSFVSHTTQTIVNDALRKDYIRIHQWVDRTSMSGTITHELPDLVSIAVNGGAKDIHHRDAIAGFLAELECYIFKRKLTDLGKKKNPLLLINKGLPHIFRRKQPDLDKNVDFTMQDLKQWLAMYILANQGKNITPQMLIRDCPDIISSIGLQVINSFISEMEGTNDGLVLVLDATRNEIAKRLGR